VKIFISFDMEGVAGIVDWSQCRAPGQPYEEGRKLLLGEVNAAIAGAVRAGVAATGKAASVEIVCNDSHGTMFNLDPEGLYGNASYVAGRHKPMYMMQGLDASFDAVFLVGYHGSISGEGSVLSHTYNPQVISHAALNGTRVGESGINALAALGYGVPIALVTGDQYTIAEAAPFCPGAQTVVTKESLTRFGAVNLHPEVARSRIAEAAQRAAQRLDELKPPAIDLPATLDVHLQTADMAQIASWVRDVTRTDLRTVQIKGDDPLAIFRAFVALTYITRVSEGR
jgi:D-amino peptidase